MQISAIKSYQEIFMYGTVSQSQYSVFRLKFHYRMLLLDLNAKYFNRINLLKFLIPIFADIELTFENFPLILT